MVPVVLAVWAGCAGGGQACTDEPDAPLFGSPSPSTGLPDDACVARCEGCDLAFAPPAYGPADVAALREWTLDPPYADPVDDPYVTGVDAPPPGTCMMVVDDLAARTYHLETTSDPEGHPGIPTHGGACGVCSTLADLAVYMENPDLTEPVRACGIASFGQDEALLGCLEALGFTRPCARIWAWNTLHTRDVCLGVCLPLLDAPYHAPDGSLNACIQCDEDESGPVFKAVAGRTRRSSGLPTALCRPCDTVWTGVHAYP